MENKMIKFPKIEQFRSVVRNVNHTARFKGDDEDGQPIYDTREGILPTLTFRGSIKIHGTNAAIVYNWNPLTFDYDFHVQSRKNVITPTKDNAGFAVFTYTSNTEKLLSLIMRSVGDIGYTPEVVRVYGEWCGCFYYDTPILLSDGTKRKIGQIVNGKEELEVMSFNFETNKLEPKKIVNWYKNGITDDWLVLNIKRRKRGGKSTRLIVTPNHMIFTKKDGKIVEKPAGELSIGDVVMTFGETLTYNIEQFIMGSLLGDGSFSGYGGYKTSHSDDNQSFYNDFISELLGNLGSTSDGLSGYGSKMRNFVSRSFMTIKGFQDELTMSGPKKPTIKYLNKLSPLGLAAWYMDDGSLINQEGRQYQCELHTLGYDYETNLLISEWFNSHGYECYVTNVTYENTIKHNIRFTVKGTKAFLSVISPYIIDGFNYKLPENLREIPKIKWETCLNEYEENLIETHIVDIEIGNPYDDAYKKMKYDIEIEDNHNYFANNILVHNSNIQKGVAVNGLDKMFVVFAIKIDNTWLTDDKLVKVKIPDEKIYNILDFPSYTIDIDFNNPNEVVNEMVELVNKVEAECPVGKAFGNVGIGEGLVWVCEEEGYTSSRYWFKTKGEKHQSSKTKTLIPVDVERINNINELVTSFVTPSRLKQGLEQLTMENLDISRKNIGVFLKWIYADIVSEELDTIMDNGFEPKDLSSSISKKSRDWFFEQENKGLGL